MSRLVRGLWHVEVRYPDRLAIEPPYPVPYDQAVEWAAVIAGSGPSSAILRRVPDTRARWEYLAPYEATDRPRWGDEA
jgi:hypothetical protein